jgi:hypothetical protein
MPPGWLLARGCGPTGLASAHGQHARGLARHSWLVGRGHGACSLRGCSGPLTSLLSTMRCCTESMTRERMRRGTHFRGRGFRDLTGDGWRRRWSLGWRNTTTPIGPGGGAAQSSAEQASPHHGSGPGPAHGGGKASGQAVAVDGGK